MRADSLNPKSLIDAMEVGGFYASTGIELKDLVIDKNSISIEVNPESGVSYKIAFIECKKGSGCQKS